MRVPEGLCFLLGSGGAGAGVAHCHVQNFVCFFGAQRRYTIDIFGIILKDVLIWGRHIDVGRYIDFVVDMLMWVDM
jgi:hypothetical protein